MFKRISLKNIVIFIVLTMLVLSSSLFVVNRNLEDIFELFTFGLLMIFVLLTYCEMPQYYRRKYIAPYVIICGILLSIGLIISEISISRKIILLFTMIAILMCSVMAEKIIDSMELLRYASYVILIASVLACFLGWLGQEKIFEIPVEKMMFSYAFNGGIIYKNYFGGNMLCVFMGLYIYYHFEKKKKIDLVAMTITILLMIASSARGALLLLLIFWGIMQIDILRRFSKKEMILLVTSVVLIGGILFLFLFEEIALESRTFLYRYRGITNYLNYFKGNMFVLLFGSSKYAYIDGVEYVNAMRRFVGVNGSYEMAYLNILIKNGMLGLIGFVIIWGRYLIIFVRTKVWKYKIAGIAVLGMLLVSGLVEAYLQSVHAVLGIFCYMILSGICGAIHKGEVRK